MDDLLGEDWQKPGKPITTAPLNASAFASNYSSLRASPQLPHSGNASPASLSRPSSTVNGSRPPTGDSFGNLLSPKPQKAAASQSMQERQKQLLDEKKRQEEQQSQLWESLGSGSGTPEIQRPSPSIGDNEDDILAAFSKDAPVNKASHFSPPPPSGPASGRSTPAVAQPAPSGVGGSFDEDDDPFGLNEVSHKSNGHATIPAPGHLGEDDDILGDLGKPVSEKPAQSRGESLGQPASARDNEPSRPAKPGEKELPADRALAELVDMGFPTDTARIALAENGGDVQNAVGWLLHQAHEESRQKVRGETSKSRSPRPRQPSSTEREATPAWLRQEDRLSSTSRRSDAASPANGEGSVSQTAQQYGTKFFKSANALWKASQKQMAKTMADFQQDGDPSQPKWMREPAPESGRPSNQTQRIKPTARAPPRAADVTDEAAMLDAPRDRPQKPPRPTAPSQTVENASRTRSPVEPLPHRQAPHPKFMQQAPPTTDKRPTAKLSRNEVDEQTAQTYVSPARRKRPTPKPEPLPEPDVDLFSSAPVTVTPATATTAPSKATFTPPVSKPSPSPATAPPRPKVIPRSIPTVSASALSTSASHRKAGGEHFKRGDYAAAHESYTAALSPLPATHPIAIIVLSNRSLTALKTGDAKVAVSDADRALEIIGANLGADEMIELGVGEPAKSMKEFYGKALIRKAEALEHMERYSDAADVWRLAIAAGVGGAVSLRGRDRCEKAAAPISSTTMAAAPKPVRNTTPGPGKGPPPKSLGNSVQRLTIASASSAEAVKKLRAANAEAEKADDEKFALADSVDGKLTAWRGGKTDNLRALLQSMDTVLWEEAGWKKVGMSDLVMPAKVKIVYMKAIAKVHPDKIPQDATTEQRMISAAVFATLNEAWDKFKKDNNL